MSLFLATLLAALPAFAGFSESDVALRSLTLKDFGQEKARIDYGVPACEAHRRMAELVRQHEAPASCPLASAYSRAVQEAAGKYIERCDEYVRFIEGLLKSPSACRLGPEQRSEEIKDALEAQTLSYERSAAVAEDESVMPEKEFERFQEADGPGEYGRAECSIPVTVAYQAIRTHAGWQARHVGYAERALGGGCTPSSPARREYEVFLSEGEEGVDKLAQSPR